MPIVLFRVDERLIHGQVVVGWGERLNIDRFIVVDDELSESAWEQELYCLGVPASIDSIFVPVAEARRSIEDWSQDSRRQVVLIRDVATLARVAEGGVLAGVEINLGGIHHAPGRERLLPYLFLNAREKEMLREIEASGARLCARDLPSTRAIWLNSLLGES
jgi:mannose/fructose/N-acetylgalactosamine-specific phosphotransferase system component IIB